MGLSKAVNVASAVALSLAFSACRSERVAAPRNEGLTRTELLDLRTKCYELARKIEAEVNIEKKNNRMLAGDLNSFTNRYDPEANRCYVEQLHITIKRQITANSR
jgi:hypothetical protein